MNANLSSNGNYLALSFLTILFLMTLAGCGSSSAAQSTVAPTLIHPSATIRPTETNTFTPQPTNTAILTPTPEMPPIFAGVAKEEEWSQAPVYSPEQAARVITYFQDPSRQPLKPDHEMKKGFLLNVGYDPNPTYGIEMSLEAWGGKGLAPLASYIASGDRHVICQVIDVQYNVQIIDLAFFGAIPNQTRNISPETLNYSKSIFIYVLMTLAAPENPDAEMKRDVTQITQYLDLVKQFQLPDFQGKPLPVVAIFCGEFRCQYEK